MGSRRSSERSSERGRGARRGLLGALLVCAGCVTVQPQEKELLADPAMVYGSGGQAGRQEAHVLENREGATGSVGSGGGCGCN